jgi:hypothetical protein
MNYAPHIAAVRAARKTMKRPAKPDTAAVSGKKWPADKSYAAFLKSRPPIPKRRDK